MVPKYWWNKKLQKPCNDVFVMVFQGQVANCDLWLIRSPLGLLLISPSGFHQSCPSPNSGSQSISGGRSREPCAGSSCRALVPLWAGWDVPHSTRARRGSCRGAEPQPGEGAAARGLSSDSNSHCVELDCAPRGAWEQTVFRVFSVANIKNKSRVVISASEQQL